MSDELVDALEYAVAGLDEDAEGDFARAFARMLAVVRSDNSAIARATVAREIRRTVSGPGSLLDLPLLARTQRFGEPSRQPLESSPSERAVAVASWERRVQIAERLHRAIEAENQQPR